MYKKKIIKHLKYLDIKKNDNILVYSKISSFGISKKNFPKFLLSCLIERVGKDGSIVMPLYTFGKKNNTYDKNIIYKNSMTGLLNIEFFKKKGIVRSNCPIHSHIGLGKNINFLNNSNAKYSFGNKSDFYYFYKRNFKLILLGCSPQEGATYLHHLEALKKVNYRKWIKIKKMVYNNELNKFENTYVNFFALKQKNVKYDFGPL